MLTTPDTGSRDVEVSVVLACRDEVGHVDIELDRILAAFEASGQRFEIVALDDGSLDGTRARLVARAAIDPRIRLLTSPTAMGAGATRRRGSLAAHGRVIVWTDCDMTYPNQLLPRLVNDLLTDPTCQQVIGARQVEAGTLRPLRAPVKASIRHLVGFRVGHRIEDLNSGMRVFYADAATDTLPLLPAGFSCTSTLTVGFLLQQRGVRYIPVDYRPRAGHSKFHPITDTARLLAQVERVIRWHRRTDIQVDTSQPAASQA